MTQQNRAITRAPVSPRLREVSTLSRRHTTPAIEPDRLLSVAQVAELLGLGERLVEELIRAGSIPRAEVIHPRTGKPVRRILVRQSVVFAYVAELEDA